MSFMFFSLLFLAPYCFLLYKLYRKTGAVGWLNVTTAALIVLQVIFCFILVIGCKFFDFLNEFCAGGGSANPGTLFGIGIVWGVIIMPLSALFVFVSSIYSIIKLRKIPT